MKIKFLQASKGDCFIISFQDEHNTPRNILIDGGMKETYFDSTINQEGSLKKEVDKIRNNNEKIDLLVLTHIDNDHILGFLKWFEHDKKAPDIIDNVWFNSGKLIAEYLKEPENSNLELSLKIFNSPETGANEAIEFEQYLIDNNIWNRKIIQKRPELNQFGVKINILSPNEKQLKKLLKEYRVKIGGPAYTGNSKKDWDLSIRELIDDEERNYKKPKDYRLKNQSSITFIITIQDKNFLFLADAPSDETVKALNNIGYSKDNQLHVEFIKLSHHGSKNNTCYDLLEIVKTDNYLISTDSSGHGHPDKRTLARILRHNPNATFHFNYEHVKNGVLKRQDFLDYIHFRAKVTYEFDF